MTKKTVSATKLKERIHSLEKLITRTKRELAMREKRLVGIELKLESAIASVGHEAVPIALRRAHRVATAHVGRLRDRMGRYMSTAAAIHGSFGHDEDNKRAALKNIDFGVNNALSPILSESEFGMSESHEEPNDSSSGNWLNQDFSFGTPKQEKGLVTSPESGNNWLNQDLSFSNMSSSVINKKTAEPGELDALLERSRDDATRSSVTGGRDTEGRPDSDKKNSPNISPRTPSEPSERIVNPRQMRDFIHNFPEDSPPPMQRYEQPMPPRQESNLRALTRNESKMKTAWDMSVAKSTRSHRAATTYDKPSSTTRGGTTRKRGGTTRKRGGTTRKRGGTTRKR